MKEVFFTDENVSHRVPKLLEVIERKHEVRHLEDHFDKGIPDTDWMPTIALWKPKPTVIAGDGRILRNPVERRVLRECDLTYVFLAPG